MWCNDRVDGEVLMREKERRGEGGERGTRIMQQIIFSGAQFNTINLYKYHFFSS